MTKTVSSEYGKALTLLCAALGAVDPKKSLGKVLARVPDFGNFEWMLTIIGLEIDLRVDIPESLADDRTQTVDSFCRAVAQLPKVDSPGYTLECLGLVAQALLSLDVASEPAEKAPRKAAARGAKAPRTQAIETKRKVKKSTTKAPTGKTPTGKATAKSRGKRTAASGR